MEIPANVANDLDNGFQMTDIDDGFQRVRTISKSEFEYRCEFMGNSIEMTIDVNTDIGDEVENIIAPYYGSIDEFNRAFEGDDLGRNMIIAECFFEQSLIE